MKSLFITGKLIWPQRVVEAFSQETGHTVRQVYFDDEHDRNSIITSGRGNSFDLVVVDAVSLDLYSYENLLLPCIHSCLEQHR